MIGVSIIIPVYNCESTVRDTIESILHQYHNDFELIIIDDCSTDKTYNIIKSYKGDKVKIFKMKDNRGPAYCMNYATSRAKYDWIGIIDSDAVAPHNWLLTFNQSLHKCDAPIIGGRYLTSPRNIFEEAVMALDRVPGNDLIFDNKHPKKPVLVGTNFFYRKEVFYKIGGFNERLRVGYDKVFQCKALELGMKIKYISNLFVYHPLPANIKIWLRREMNFRRWDIIARINTKLMNEVFRTFWLRFSLVLIPMIVTTIFYGIKGLLYYFTFAFFLIILIASYRNFRRCGKVKIAFLSGLLTIISQIMTLWAYISRRKPEKYWK